MKLLNLRMPKLSATEHLLLFGVGFFGFEGMIVRFVAQQHAREMAHLKFDHLPVSGVNARVWIKRAFVIFMQFLMVFLLRLNEIIAQVEDTGAPTSLIYVPVAVATFKPSTATE